MRNRLYKIGVVFTLSLMTTACFQTGQLALPSYYPIATQQPYQQYSEHPQPYPAQNYSIPPGHMPPPGECRIWYPDRPAGQQPPPGKCKKLQRNVPYGATLIRG